jgi:hypothetical protein
MLDQSSPMLDLDSKGWPTPDLVAQLRLIGAEEEEWHQRGRRMASKER